MGEDKGVSTALEIGAQQAVPPTHTLTPGSHRNTEEGPKLCAEILAA